MTIFTDGPVLRDAILVHRVLSTDRKNYVIKKALRRMVCFDSLSDARDYTQDIG